MNISCDKCGRRISPTKIHLCPPSRVGTGNVVAGERYGRLVAICPSEYSQGKDSRPQWECACDCGNKKIALAKTLRNGMTKSCGCLMQDHPSRLSHGQSNTHAYYRWRNMLNRCYFKQSKSYPDYGGRGITVCDRWRSFENFYADMGEPPFAGATIERSDNDAGYSPDNCCWATRDEQIRNRRNAVWVTLNEESRSLKEWSAITGIKAHTIEARLSNGWTVERALTTPTGGACA